MSKNCFMGRQESNHTADLLVDCGLSYKHFTLVNYNSRVAPDLKIPHIMTLES